MNYRVTINRKNYDLPPRTLEMDERIMEIGRLDERYSAGEITRAEVVEAQHNFVLFCAPESLPPVNEVDVNDLLTACISIISAYNAPAIKAKVDAQTAAIKGVLNSSEVQQLLKLDAMQKNK